MLILFAHEDELIRKGLVEFLREMGHEVVDIKSPGDIDRYLQVRPSFQLVVAYDDERTREGFFALERHHQKIGECSAPFILMSDEATIEEVEALDGHLLLGHEMDKLMFLIRKIQRESVA